MKNNDDERFRNKLNVSRRKLNDTKIFKFKQPALNIHFWTSHTIKNVKQQFMKVVNHVFIFY